MVKLSLLSSWGVAVGLVAAVLGPVAQEMTFRDLAQGVGTPSSRLAPAELPAEARPVMLTLKGAAGMGDATLKWTATLFGVSPGMTVAGQAYRDLITASFAHWTDGSRTKIGGIDFLVTYRIPFSMATLAGMSDDEAKPPAEPTSNLDLVLVRLDAIETMAVLPGWDRARLAQVIAAPVQPDGIFQQAKKAAHRTRAISHAKQLTLATLMYAADYDDHLPFVQSTAQVRDLIMPYIEDGEMDTANPNGGRFLFNMRLAGVSLTSVKNSASTVLWFDEKSWPDGGRVVGYLDGSAKYLEQSVWRQAEAEKNRQTFKRRGKPIAPPRHNPDRSSRNE